VTAAGRPRSSIRRGALASLLALGAAPAPVARGDSALAPDVAAALAAIRPAAIAADVRFLADDLLEGRGTGTRGHEVAARYVAAQLSIAGLEPGAGGGWLQPVPLRRAALEEATLELLGPSGESTRLVAGTDYVTAADPRPRLELEAPIVFVGYGIAAPEAGRDDYAGGLDLRDQVVAFLGGVPSTLPPPVREQWHAARKAEVAAARGAVGVLQLWSPEEEAAGPWETVLRSLGSGTSLLPREAAAPGAAPRPRASAWLGPAATRVLLATSPPGPAPHRLPVRLRMNTRSRVEELDSPNVVGLWRGADPALRDEYVVLSAHLDHLGIGPAVDGDAVYNGAVDDASGVATVLAVARALPRLPPLRRSLLIVATTGEEAGLLGAAHLVRRPPPGGAIVANLNVDAGAVWAFDALTGRGAERSTLGGALAAASAAGVPVAPDPLPERFAGSDQFAFSSAGVPAMLIGTKGSGAALQRKLEYARQRYHTPADDLAQPLDFEATARFARAVLLVARAVADGERRPQWHPGFAPPHPLRVGGDC
jgi:hypothetical protein